MWTPISRSAGLLYAALNNVGNIVLWIWNPSCYVNEIDHHGKIIWNYRKWIQHKAGSWIFCLLYYLESLHIHITINSIISYTIFKILKADIPMNKIMFILYHDWYYIGVKCLLLEEFEENVLNAVLLL